jgi:hypothetical protein
MIWQAVFAFAVLCAGVGALCGSRTATALLVSTAFTTGLSVAGAPFLPLAWIAADLLAIAAILRWGNARTDRFVLALYPASWLFDFIDGDTAYACSVVVCSAQLILTLPFARILQRTRSLHLHGNLFDHFDLRARHEGAA